MGIRKTAQSVPAGDASDSGDPSEAWERMLDMLPAPARDALAASPDDTPPPAPRHVPLATSSAVAPDGPQPRGLFFWGGKRCDLSSAPDRYELVKILWDSKAGKPHTEVPVDDVLDTLYGDDEDMDETKISAKKRRACLKNLRSNVRKVFLDNDFALDVRCRGGKIWLQELN